MDEKYSTAASVEVPLDLLPQVLEALPVGVWIMDRTGCITHGNPAGRRIWGGARYVGPEMFGEYKGWWADTGRRIAADEWAAARAITKGETSLDEVIDIECFDGSRKTILNSALPLRNPDGKIIGAIIINQDITDRRRSELERERLVRQLQEAVAQVHTLSGLLPICAGCKKIRDETGRWLTMETYVEGRSTVQFSHGICPDCKTRYYPAV
jgi:PAS domain S-box-containing protein